MLLGENIKNVNTVGGFHTTTIQDGLLFNDKAGIYPSSMWGFDGENREHRLFGSEISTTFGVVNEGEIYIQQGNQKWGPLTSGYYFSIVGDFEIHGTGKAVLFDRIGQRGIFNIGGPIENRGRLTYIDGCSDTLLIYPPRLGDACMNILWFPEKVRQTTHTHPTVRYGLVIRGYGRCITPDGELPLEEGKIFRLEEMSPHCFYTDDSKMAIVTYHPDSDWGPTDENHPMINRTLT